MRTCSIEGCNEEYFAKTTCKKHYEQTYNKEYRIKNKQKVVRQK